MGKGRNKGKSIAIRGAAEAVSIINHWVLRLDPRESAALWKPSLPGSDRETWHSMDYDDRERFSTLVDPWCLRRGPGGTGVFRIGNGTPFPWWVIALITGCAAGCLGQLPCRRILLRRMRPEWYDLDRQVLGKVECVEVVE